MQPVSPVMPGSESIEVVLGDGQPQYQPLPAVWLDTPDVPMVTRWTFTDVEREMIFAGGDIVLIQLTWEQPFHPVSLQVVLPGQVPVLPDREVGR